MPVPTRTETLNTFITATGQNRRPGLVDAYFGSAPFLARLRAGGDETVRLSGGSDIRESFVYTNFPSSSFGRGDTFDTSVTEFSTTLRFDWKYSYAALNLNVIDIDLNDSPEQTFDLVEAAMETAELSLIDDASTQLFADGSGNAGNDMDGLAIAVSQTGTYGGIARATTVNSPQRAIRAAVEDTTGGALSLGGVNSNFGSVQVGREKPDLLVTTQTLWNRIWERSQAADRNKAESDRDIGFESVRFNGADVTVDSHCPSGFLYYLNTKWFRFYIHRKWDFRMRGPMEPTNQMLQIGQLVVWANMVCRAPRFQGVASGLT
jgi:hypothetical protein